MEIIFKSCCGIVYLIALAFGLNYYEMNTYLFLYAEPLICFLTAIIMVLVVYKKLWNFWSWQRILLALVSTGYLFTISCGLFRIAGHYWSLNAEDACKLAMREMQNMAVYGLSYEQINIMLFIVLFLLILTINIGVIFLCKRYLKGKSKHDFLSRSVYMFCFMLILMGGFLFSLFVVASSNAEPMYRIYEENGKFYAVQEGLITGYNDKYPSKYEITDPEEIKQLKKDFTENPESYHY